MLKQSKEEQKNELNIKRQLEQSVFEKMFKDLYSICCKAGFQHIEMGDKFMKVTDEHRNFKIELSVKVGIVN